MREAYLEMVTAANNNKYYHMLQENESSFSVKYGRIGGSVAHATYPMSAWYTKYNEKIRKGYQDVTQLRMTTVVEKVSSEYLPIQDPDIASLIDYLRQKANDIIHANYKVDANVVTPAMVSEAQAQINELLAAGTAKKFNDILLQLFVVLPRKMRNVPDYLLKSDTPDERQKIITREQQLLDVMSSQVTQTPTQPQTTPGTTQKNMTILEAFGLTIEPVTESDVTLIKKQLGECADSYYKAWKVTNAKTEEAFQKNVKAKKLTKSKRKYFWHGSRTENWWGILRTGLCLRPTNVVTNGKMFGLGIYFAPKAKKSVGYTSLSGSCWAGGSSKFGFLALFETAYGTPYVPSQYSASAQSYNYNKLQTVSPGADCLHAKAGMPCGGWDLRNDEIVFYREDQMTIRYLVELKG